jgi:hypothetical protein
LNDGYDWVVNIHLRKFFDTVDQDRLIRLIDNTFQNSDLTALTRKFITAGVMIRKEVIHTRAGIPQGGPPSAVLANLYLDQAHKELERRGLRFTRFLEEKLKLIVNAGKSKVARPDEIKYPGFGFGRNRKGMWEARIYGKSLDCLTGKIRELTKRNWSIASVFIRPTTPRMEWCQKPGSARENRGIS